jgi:putative glycosyltransferase (TIGR04372 family)
MKFQSAVRWARYVAQRRFGRLMLRLGFLMPGASYIYCQIAGRLAPLERRLLVSKTVALLGKAQRRRLAERLARYTQKPHSIGFIETCWLSIAETAAVATVSTRLFDRLSPQMVVELRANTNFLFACAIAAYETSHFRDAVVAFSAIRKLTRRELRQSYNYLKAAHAAGQVRDKALAAEFFARQFYFSDISFDVDSRRQFERRLMNDTMAAAFSEIQRYSYRGPTTRIGVFFLSSTEALGHAILDPYYFLAMHSKTYDAIIFLGAPLDKYRPASRICLEIVQQYGYYVETDSNVLLNLSWMSLGTVSQQAITLTHEEAGGASGNFGRWYVSENIDLGPVELVIENYWSLLREAVHRTRDANDPFQHNAWHMKVPERFVLTGEAFCIRHKIDLDKPIVVLHARADNYHGLEKQAFRNTDIDTYIPAIQYLLNAGYQVVRIGDRGMPRLRIMRKGYFELPFAVDYEYELDPFFISRAVFMIGCQSGPCAYARALGTPLLSVNAVLHFTLLPGSMEMGCFKHYVQVDGKEQRPMSLEAALAAGVYHFDTTIQFKRAGIQVRPAMAEEIVGAVADMVAWIKQPDLAETPLQLRFKAAVEATAEHLARSGTELAIPVGDFIGISLPGYRISPTVAAAREISTGTGGVQKISGADHARQPS